MKRSQFILVLTSVFLLACEPELTMRERAVEEQAVELQFNALVRLMNNARVDSILALYHESPGLRVMWSDGTRADGHEAAGQAMKDFYGKINYMNFVPQNPEFHVLNKDVALTTFRHSTDIVMAGGQRLPVSSGQGMVVWVKDHGDDMWKVETQFVAVNARSLQ
jgi:hypothetical protein